MTKRSHIKSNESNFSGFLNGSASLQPRKRKQQIFPNDNDQISSQHSIQYFKKHRETMDDILMGGSRMMGGTLE